MKNIEQQRFIDIETRSLEVKENEGKRIIQGIIPFNSKSEYMGFYEVIAPSAFNKTLSDGANVVALVSHDTSKILGSTRAGTLKLEVIEDGLLCSCELGNTSYSNDTWEVINRGDCKTMSFGFIPVKYKDEGEQRTLTEVKLLEISYSVAMPAYSETDSVAYLRNLDFNKLNNDEIKIIQEKMKEIRSEEKSITIHNEGQENIAVVPNPVPPVNTEIVIDAKPEIDTKLLELRLKSLLLFNNI